MRNLAVTLNRIRFMPGLILIFWLSYLLDLNYLLPVLLVAIFGYLRMRRANLKNYSLLNFLFLFLLSFSAAYFLLRQEKSIFYLPFAAIPMLAALLFNEIEIAFVINLALAFFLAGLSGNNFSLGALFFTSGLTSSLLVFGARQRSTVIRTGFITGLFQAGLYLLLDRFSLSAPKIYTILFINGIVSSIIVVGTLPVFEYLFGTVTNISLLELADPHQPLLRRLILETPGTYHHSLIVGNLSEAAAGAIGANTLLARIGSYYHDIGKLEKAEYFSENQQVSKNKHENLSPSMSKLVIMHHVKVGVELAKRHRLNPRIIDFIQEHHGNSLVYYFYRRALETLEEDQKIQEEGFRYPGPKPASKETAIVLLADSVEAASRALKDQAPEKIKELVHKIINNKFIDGQLDSCELTLKDLEKIAAVFIHILSGIYHSRVTYP